MPSSGRSHLPFAGFRPDIQGLRAVAVGVVLLYHANAPFLPGGFVGVDVFFVISGYLITGLLVREALSTGRIGLADFYARRARRILPAATVVLVATLVLTVVFLPEIRWQQVGSDAAGAALYVVNWMYATSTDYLNADVAASPIQHFWTLSVEEQFYIIWPLVLILLLAVLAKRTGGRSAMQANRVLQYAGFGVLAILVPSFMWSVFYTATHAAPAYFVTTTRLWELAIGAALAVFAHHLVRLPDRIGIVLGWGGLAGILAASTLYSSASPAFPGFAALLPTLSAAAVIVGGMNGRAERGAGVLLGIRPMRWIGDISYSLYLWHWPLIVVATFLLGGDLRFRYGLLVVVLAIVPAYLSYRFIETPFRDWSRLKESVRASLWSGAALVAVTLVLAAAVIAIPKLTADATNISTDQPIGAEALTQDFSNDALSSFSDAGAPVDVVTGGFVPSAVDAREDNSIIYDNGCQLDPEIETPNGCEFGDLESETTVVLVGDSHAANWVPTLERLANQEHWKLVTHTKSACSFAAAPQGTKSGPYEECNEWNKLVLDEIVAENPELVVTINAGRRGVWQDGALLDDDPRLEAFAAGLHETWSELTAVGIPVAVIADTPDMGIDVPECVSANPDALAACSVARTAAIDDQPHPEPLAIAGLQDVSLIDMNNWICPDAEVCPAIVGNVLVWRDNQHLTATYAETLTQPLRAALQRTPQIDHLLFGDER